MNKDRFSGEYPKNWNEIAKAVKEVADWKCVRCRHDHEPKSGYCLTVHHLDGQKDNCAWWNIPALCQRCHLHIQSKVVMERRFMFEHSAWFKPYVAAYYYTKTLSQPITKDYQMSLLLVPREMIEKYQEDLLQVLL